MQKTKIKNKVRKVKKEGKTIGKSLFAVIKKDFKTVFRSKSSAFAVILGPLIVMLLIMLAFNNSSLFDIPLGSYSEGYSNLSNDIIEGLEETSYIVTKTNSSEDCVRGVQSGEYSACLIISKDMVAGNKANNKITFHVDPSRVNIVHNIISDINREVSQTSGNLSLGLTTTIVDQLFSTKTELNKNADLLSTIQTNQGTIKAETNKIGASIGEVDLDINNEDFKMKRLRDFLEDLNSSYNFTQSDYNTLDDRLDVVNDAVDAAVTKIMASKAEVNKIKGFSGEITTRNDANVDHFGGIQDNTNNIITGIDGISVTNPNQIVSPIKTEIEAVESQEKHIAKFLPTLLILIIMFVSIFLASSLILNEKMSSAYFRNTITSTPAAVFLLGAFVTTLAVVFFQLLIISLILGSLAGYGFGVLVPAILPLLLITIMFILLGITIGYFSNSQESSNVISLVIITAAIFLSNTILPLESLPYSLKQIILYNPFVIGESLVKKIIMFEFGFLEVGKEFLVVIGYGVLFSVLSGLGLKYSKNKVRK